MTTKSEKFENFDSLPNTALISTRTLAMLLELAPTTLRNHRHFSRGIPYVRINGTIRYKVSVVRKYLQDLENWETRR